MKYKSILLPTLTLILNFGFHPQAIADVKKADPKPDMHLLLDDIQALQNYIISEKAFQDPANEAQIDSRLKHMEKHVESMDGKLFADDPALQANLSMLKGHMQETRNFFEHNNKPFARFMVMGALQMCVSCHTRNNSGNELDFPLQTTATDVNDFDRAQFYFATRQFSKALDQFKQIVDKYPANKAKPFEISKALIDIAITYARVKNDPAAGADYFAKAAKNQNLPEYVKKDSAAWTKSFRAWSKEGNKDYKKMKAAELLADAKKILKKGDLNEPGYWDRSFYVDRLRASALLHRVLDLPENSLAKGESLYLLGLIYHHIDNNLFFYFDEMYLKACITSYPKTTLAKNCYDALERVLLEGYSGSAGVNLPNEAEVELMKLKKLAY